MLSFRNRQRQRLISRSSCTLPGRNCTTSGCSRGMGSWQGRTPREPSTVQSITLCLHIYHQELPLLLLWSNPSVRAPGHLWKWIVLVSACRLRGWLVPRSPRPCLTLLYSSILEDTGHTPDTPQHRDNLHCTWIRKVQMEMGRIWGSHVTKLPGWYLQLQRPLLPRRRQTRDRGGDCIFLQRQTVTCYPAPW